MIIALFLLVAQQYLEFRRPNVIGLVGIVSILIATIFFISIFGRALFHLKDYIKISPPKNESADSSKSNESDELNIGDSSK